MIQRILLSFILWLVVAATPVQAKLILPSVFSDNMVLQQKDNVPLWGRTSARNTVSITTSWNQKKYVVQADSQGAWMVKLTTPTAGGPYTITFNDGEKLTLTNILIGEVWVCSGQSNMEMPLKGFGNQPILHSGDILLEADNPQIRMIRYERALTRTPQFDDQSTSWQVSDAQSAREFSAVGYQFAQLLQRKLKVPVGIIMSTWGGTRIEAWMTEKSLKAFPEVSIPAVTDTSKIIKNDPTVLFNAMIYPFLGYGIRGVLWYQGEANRSNAQIYDRLMAAMVQEWRGLWHRNFPFYYVQIAPFTYKDTTGQACLLREAQSRASTQIPNVGMVVTMDVGAEHSIHPPDKTTIAKRLACWALAHTYGWKGLPFASPVYQSMKIDKDTVTLTFAHAENGLTSFGRPLAAFEVAGADKVFYPATARITGKGVVVQSAQVREPVAVRYAYKDWVVGDLYNVEGLPAVPFRTDNW
jgi:sialate O-acetylesterase